MKIIIMYSEVYTFFYSDFIGLKRNKGVKVFTSWNHCSVKKKNHRC